MNRLTGVIDKMAVERGWGFVKTPRGGRYFLHVKQLLDPRLWDTVRVGDSVEFDAGPTPSRVGEAPPALRVGCSVPRGRSQPPLTPVTRTRFAHDRRCPPRRPSSRVAAARQSLAPPAPCPAPGPHP